MTESETEAITEIDRRLNQDELTALDRAMLIAKRKEIYQRLHPTNKNPNSPDVPGAAAPADTLPTQLQLMQRIWNDSSETERRELLTWLDREEGH